MRCRLLCFVCTVIMTLGVSIFVIYRSCLAHKTDDLSEVDITQHPYMVSVEREGRHHCAGAVLSPRLVLTAAHCFQRSANYSVRAGTTTAGKGGSQHDIERTLIHPKFSSPQVAFDVAVLKVHPPFQLSRNLRAVRLAEFGDPEPTGFVAELIGWGHTKNPLEESKSLRRVQVHIVDEAVCQVLDSGLPTAKGLTLCGRFFKKRDPYVGDPGAPLVVRGTAVGVAGWRLLVASRGTAGAQGPFEAFVAVPPLRPWIEALATQVAAADELA